MKESGIGTKQNHDIDTSGYDITAWQHYFFRPSYYPYNPKEIKIIKGFTDLDDVEYEKTKKGKGIIFV